MPAKKKENTLDKIILQTIKKEEPENVKALAEAVCEKSSTFSKATVIKSVKKLELEGKVSLVDDPVPKKGRGLAIVVILTIITNILVFAVSEQSVFFPLRLVVGYLFCFFVPGYSTINLLFSRKELSAVEKLILSIAMSLAIIPLVGMFVNFATGSLALPYILFSLSTLVLALAVAAYFKNG